MRTQTQDGLAEAHDGTATTWRADVWLWLTVPLAILVATVSGIGLLVPGVYKDPPAWAIQGVAQDFTDLVVVGPVLVVSAVLATRGSQRARLVWLGTLTYLVYAFVIYAFAVQHNPLFLLYVAGLGCSLWAVIGGMVTTDWIAIQPGVSAAAPVKVVSLFLIVLAALFSLVWLGDEVPALLSGGVPASIKDMGVPTNPVHVLDFAMLLPTMLVAGIWLWRKRTIGYGLAAMMLVHTIFQALGIAAVMVFSLRAGLPGASGVAFGFIALAVATLALLGWHLSSFSFGPAQRSPAPRIVA